MKEQTHIANNEEASTLASQNSLKKDIFDEALEVSAYMKETDEADLDDEPSVGYEDDSEGNYGYNPDPVTGINSMLDSIKPTMDLMRAAISAMLATKKIVKVTIKNKKPMISALTTMDTTLVATQEAMDAMQAIQAQIRSMKAKIMSVTATKGAPPHDR